MLSTIAKFRRRFSFIENALSQSGKSLEDVDLAAMDKLWDDAKLLEKDAAQ
jgi:uncharacterized protein YabN with tetrapyrrole methylase and pyrophosphatase domain